MKIVPRETITGSDLHKLLTSYIDIIAPCHYDCSLGGKCDRLKMMRCNMWYIASEMILRGEY